MTYSSPNVPAGLLDFPPYNKETVETPQNATVDDENFARLLASPGIALGLGSYHGELELKYPSVLPANTTTYIRVDGSDGLFNLLLGGSLGELLGDVLSLVALGQQEFTIIARNGSTDVFSRSTTQGFDTARARVITGADGNFYIAITPDGEYDRVFIENGSLSLLGLGDEVNLDVFNAFNYESASICGNPVGTSYDVSGVNLDLLNLSGSAADDLHFAIDGDESTYTALSPGVLSVAGVLEQHFYFDGLGKDTDEVMVTFSANPDILDVNLLGNIELVVYNGDTEVGRQDLENLGSDLLGIAQLDLLGLLVDGETVTFTMTPGSAFDRFEIEVSTLVDLGTSQSLRVHEVSRTPGRPVIDGVDDEQNMLVCAGEDVTLNAAVASGDQVKWYDAPTGGNLLHTGASFHIGQVGGKSTYYAATVRTGCAEESIRVPATVDINKNPLISLNGSAVYNMAIGDSFILPAATAVNEDGSDVPVTWAALDGAPFTAPNIAGEFTQGGRYVYRVSATGTECTNFVDVVVNVFDPDGCPPVYNRRYATSADDFTTSSLLGLQLGSVSDEESAAGDDMKDYSELLETVGTSLLGLTGETSQTVRWNTMVPAGTPVSIKLGREYGAAGVAGGIYVQAVDGDPVNGDELLGVRQVADANLVSAVNGINEFVYTFIPVDANGVPVPYNAVKISLASLLNAVQQVRVYGAYYHETSTTLESCTFGKLDYLTGFEAVIGGLDVASGLTSVTDPGLAFDNDESTYAVMNNAVGANVSTKLDVTFAAPAIAGDSVFIKVGAATGLLDLTLLEGYTIQRYLGNQEVGEPLDVGSSLLELRLLEGDTEQALTFINDTPFDRIKILTGGVVEAIDNLRVYEVKLIPLGELDSEQHDEATGTDYIEICPGDIIELPDASCDQIKFYTDETGNIEITIDEIADWAPGTVQTVYLQVVRFGCENGIDRRPIEIRVKESSDDLLDNILVNGVDAGAFCPSEGPVTLEASLISDAPSGVTYQWFSDNAGTPEPLSGETSATVELSGLAAGDYTYYVSLTAGEFCTAAPIPVDFTINRSATNDDINIDDLTQCVGVPAMLSPSSGIANPVFTWYYDAAKTAPITDGDTDGGISYAINADGELTITGIADGASEVVYVTVTGDEVCENVEGKEVTVTISDDLPAPTFTTADVSLCGTGQEAVFEVTNEAGGFIYAVYDAETGGSEVTTGVSITDNIITLSNVTADASYWVAVNAAGGCVGTVRSEISVTVLPIANAADLEVIGAPICEGQTTTLSASSSSVTNPIFRWYSDADLTNLIFEGFEYEVSPSSTTTYYVTVQGDGICENVPGTAEAATLTVNEVPDVPGVSGDVRISEGFGTMLNASAGEPAPANVEIVWYDEGGNELATGASYNTGPLSQGTYTYYAQARNTVSGCTSAGRGEVTVTVGPPNPIEDCTIANAQTNGTDPVCVLCTVENPNNAVDGDLNTYARFVAPASVSGGVWQELKFPSNGAAGDTITVTIGSGGSLIDLGLLSGLQFETYNGATSNSDGGVVDDNVIDLRLLEGQDDKAEIVFVAGGNFDRVRISYMPLAGVLNSGWRVYQAQINYAAPTAISTGVEVCSGDMATLSATPGDGTTLRWYDAPTGGTMLEEGNSYTTGALTTPGTVTYYLAIVKGACEDPDRIPVDVVVKPSPTATDITVSGNENPICADVPVVLTPSVATGSTLVTAPGTFSWYLDADRTMPINDGDVDGDINYAIDANGVLTITGLNAASSPYTYFVSVLGDNGCENVPGNLKEAPVTINKNATDADIGLADEITQCVGLPVTLSPATGIVDPMFNWYLDEAKTMPINDGDTSGSMTFTITPTGALEIDGIAENSSEMFYVTVSGRNVCENTAGKGVNVRTTNTLDKPVLNQSDMVVCGAGNDAVFDVTNSTSGLIYKLYDAETGGNEVTEGISISNDIITLENVSADATYWVEVNGTTGCAGDERTSISVTVNAVGTAADINAGDATICAGDSYTLSASTSTIDSPVFTWYTDAALNNVLTDLTVSPSSTRMYYVTVSGNGVCENPPGDAKAVTITVNRNAVKADIETTDETICEGDTFTLSASSQTITDPVFTWYSDASLTTPLSSTDVTPTATTTYYVAVSADGVCASLPSEAEALTVTVNRNAGADDIVAEGATICEGDSHTLSASSNTVDATVFTWYSDEDLTTPLSGTEVSPTATTTYYVTVSGEGVCENRPGTAKDVTITVNRNAGADDIEAEEATICEGNSYTLSASSITVDDPVFTWYSDEDLTMPLSGTDVTPAATTTYYVTVSGVGVCENKPGSAKAVTITVNRNATQEDIDASGGTICAGDTFTLSAASTTVESPVFTWYTDAALTTEVTDPEVMPAATRTYYVTVSGEGVCANNPDEAVAVTVTVNRNATSSDIQADGGTICEGDSFPLNATSTTIDSPVFTWYTDAALTNELTDATVSPEVTTTYYVAVSGDGVCANKPGQGKAVTVTVNRGASADDIEADGATICAGDTFTLEATSAISNASFTWYSDAALTNPISDLEVSPTSTTTYYVTVTGADVCENASGDAKEVTVTVNRIGTASDIQADGDTICAGGNHTLSATSSIDNATFRWYADEDLTTEITNAVVSPSATTTYYVTVSGDGVCENRPGTAKAVTVMVNRNATAGDIDADDGAICPGETFTLSANSSVAGSVFTWYEDAGLTTELTGMDVMPTATTTYYVTVQGDGVCENKPGEALAVTVAVNSVPAPTTDMTTQTFCGAGGGTIANLQVNEANVVWYDAATGGNRLDASEALVEGMTYYAARVDVNTGCESADRLAIMVADCAHLEVTKTAELPTVVVGQMFNYTIAITNTGLVPAQNVVVTDDVPVELQVLEASHDGAISGNNVTWSIAAIGAGETLELTLGVMALTESQGVVNSVTADSDNSDPDDDDSDPTTILSDDVDLAMDKVVSAPVIEIGQEFTYTLTVTNKTATPALNVTLTDYMPDQVRYLGSNAPADIIENYDAASGELTFTIPEIPGETVVEILLRVEAQDSGLVTNSAAVEAADQVDRFEGDNTATISHDQLEITIPNVFSPNGDGINDTWEIEGLTELYPDNEIIVVNRWGGEVFKTSNYQNDWDGGSLDEGTYYYRVIIRDGDTGRETEFTGYVTILR
ncbi:DUF11 domain-containing protein [Echinicola soli]|uniref:DUF11 domain-containing protein n=1 Tax=Echinicola soli TaxID=2591634 RepID=A0A514CHZ0_9BACT|nr:gliding motility-associated C-terminal domain-containing protein [Echinicola soli]QDH79390.1 DUF11 domain-containing protein [Echinicola soli]